MNIINNKFFILVLIVLGFCNISLAADDSRLDDLEKKIQKVQDSIAPMLANLEQSLQSQIATADTNNKAALSNVQDQIASVQSDLDAKLKRQGQDSTANIEKTRSSIQTAITALQGQIVQIQTNLNKKILKISKK
ncbi:MAG: hypothetical protein VX335_02550 [Pseudomonadota bacterium]|nr:hypothetical protein [Pseudomonadota bacterium]